MKGKKLYEALGYVDEKYLNMVDALEKEHMEMKHKQTRLSARKAVTALVAAVLCISILAVTAMAAGWIPSLFATLKEIYPQDEELFEAAAQANTNAASEIFELPQLDLSQFTLLEQYFDGETILIGYNLDIVQPEPIVGIEPDADLLKRIRESTQITTISWDSSQTWLDEPTTENAAKYNLSADAALMDQMLKGTLSESDYMKAWEILEAQGYVCIAVQNAWLGDHILINGVDTVEAYMESNAYADRTEYTSELGNCIRLEPLPDDVRSQKSVTVTLNVKSSVHYWYLDLDGNGRIYYDSNNIMSNEISFELKKVS